MMASGTVDSYPVANSSPPLLHPFVGIQNPPTATFVGITNKGYSTTVPYCVMDEYTHTYELCLEYAVLRHL